MKQFITHQNIALTLLILAGCTSQNAPSLNEQIASKPEAEQQKLLHAECLAKTQHKNPTSMGRNTTDRDLLTVCNKMDMDSPGDE